MAIRTFTWDGKGATHAMTDETNHVVLNH